MKIPVGINLTEMKFQTFFYHGGNKQFSFLSFWRKRSTSSSRGTPNIDLVIVENVCIQILSTRRYCYCLSVVLTILTYLCFIIILFAMDIIITHHCVLNVLTEYDRWLLVHSFEFWETFTDGITVNFVPFIIFYVNYLTGEKYT